MLSHVFAITAILAATATPPAAFTADCAARPATALAAALAASRARAPDTPATITVTGTCRVSEPVTLGPADDRLTIAGGGDSPTISGGIAIASWKEHAEAACDACGNPRSPTSVMARSPNSPPRLLPSREQLHHNCTPFPRSTFNADLTPPPSFPGPE